MKLADYLKIDSLSSGMCHTILTRSPYHAKHARENKEDASSAMDIGTVAHQLWLEEDENNIAIIDAEDWRTKAAQQLRIVAREAGQTPVLVGKMHAIRAMVAAADEFIDRAEERIRDARAHGTPEQTIEWTQDGVACKARPDWLSDDHTLILHYKTTAGSAEPNSWIRNQLFGMGYDLAAVFYELAYPAAESVFLVQETSPPFCCSLIGLDPMTRDNAQRKVTRAINVWRECLATGRYPAYPASVCYAEVPAWEMANVERMMVGEIDPIQMRDGIQA